MSLQRGAFVLALAILALVGAEEYRSLLEVEDSMVAVAHTQEVLRRLNRIEADMALGESARRGYVLSKDAALLDELRATPRAVEAGLRGLASLTADTARQRSRLEALTALVMVRLRQLEETVSGPAARPGLESVRATEEGAELMARARAVIAETRDEESALLIEREARSRSRSKRARLVFLCGSVAAFGVVLTASLALRGASARRRRAEAEARRADALFRLAAENLPIGLWVIDAAGKLVYGNPAARGVWAGERLVGPERYGEYKGFWPDTGKPIAAEEWAAARTLRTGETFLNELVDIECFDGTLKTILNSTLPIRDESGAITGVLAVNQDVTERQRVERELRENEARYRSIFESVPVAILEQDWSDVAAAARELRAQGVADFARHFGEHLELVPRLLGATKNRAANARLLELFGARSLDEITAARETLYRTAEILRAGLGQLAAFAEGRRTHFSEIPLRTLAGGEVFLAVTHRFPEPGSGSARVLVCLTDITERKRSAERLERMNAEFRELTLRAEQATRTKSAFLASMSHELRTPLNAIVGFSELLHDGKAGPLSEEQREYLGDVLQSARHLLRLINDVLDLSRVEAGRLEFHPEAVDLSKLLLESRDMVREAAARKRLALAVESDPALTGIVVDPARLKQVVYNYLSNAVKFTGEGGRVNVRGRAEAEGFFRLEVEDDGVGIAPEDQVRLFREFEQVDSEPTRRAKGTGLGLAVTKRIVEGQGGRVGVFSTPGKGSVFWATLPRVAAGAAAEPLAVVPLAARGAPRVLVVEDDFEDRAFLVRVLSGAGYAVEVAATGATALLRCREQAFDAITLDLILPDMSGWEVVRALREEGPSRNAVVVVATVVAERSGGAGVRIDDYLVKPFRPEELLAALARAAVVPGVRPVLVVDDDVATLKVAEKTLAAHGYAAVCCADGESGLRVAAERPPAAVVLDLLMPGMDGFEFLDRLRAMAPGSRVPVVVWTSKDLSAEERTRLRGAAEGLVLKRDGGAAALLDELNACLAPAQGGGA